ncbi:hypothetical protein Aple_065950 [Acrocarpospora pleiomorpha]|uniref:Uncharacterized protein n=1 Tax=Acrocarpospora pleiomorpha TaxID=90975 RepID=A0A5M3XSC6_9ACTN|nr:DUF6247 family protein [Acrocarpospora pleiomorpha]GES23696.1 hypothetical protein Aple_065950 [Acrocarpospora pleiomorpha]
MSAEHIEPVDHGASGGFRIVLPRSLRAIRDGLLPEDVGDFDSEFRQLMAEATESLDLGPLTEFVERWGAGALVGRSGRAPENAGPGAAPESGRGRARPLAGRGQSEAGPLGVYDVKLLEDAVAQLVGLPEGST